MTMGAHNVPIASFMTVLNPQLRQLLPHQLHATLVGLRQLSALSAAPDDAEQARGDAGTHTRAGGRDAQPLCTPPVPRRRRHLALAGPALPSEQGQSSGVQGASHDTRHGIHSAARQTCNLHRAQQGPRTQARLAAAPLQCARPISTATQGYSSAAAPGRDVAAQQGDPAASSAHTGLPATARGQSRATSTLDMQHVATLQPLLQHQLTNAHREAAPDRLQALLDALPRAPTTRLSPSDPNHLNQLPNDQLQAVANDCRVHVPDVGWQGGGGEEGVPVMSEIDSQKRRLAQAVAYMVRDQLQALCDAEDARLRAAMGGRRPRGAQRVPPDWSTVIAAERAAGAGSGAAGATDTPAPIQPDQDPTNNTTTTLSAASTQSHIGTDNTARDLEALTQSLWEEQDMDERVRTVLKGAARPSLFGSQAPLQPAEQTDTDASTNSDHVDTAHSTHPLLSPPEVSFTDPTSPYAPPPDATYARRHIRRTMQKLLDEQGYFRKTPDQWRANHHLRPKELWAVLEDCGVFPPDTATHRDLAVAIAGLVRLADTTAFAAHSAHPPLEALLARNPQIPARWETAGEVPQPEQVAAAAAAAAVRAVRSGATAGAVTEQTHVQGTNTTTTSEETIYEEYEGAARTALWHSLLSAENVVSWLQAARAQDIVLLTRTESSPGSGSDGLTRWMVVATAASDRHAAACAGAVRYQAQRVLDILDTDSLPDPTNNSDLISDLVSSESSQLISDLVSSIELPTPQGTDPLSDWASLDIGLGHVVHVLTRQARDYYQLEAKWLGLDRSRATGVRRSRYRGLKRVDIVTDRDAQGAVKTAYEVVRYRPSAEHSLPLTLDSITATQDTQNQHQGTDPHTTQDTHNQHQGTDPHTNQDTHNQHQGTDPHSTQDTHNQHQGTNPHSTQDSALTLHQGHTDVTWQQLLQEGAFDLPEPPQEPRYERRYKYGVPRGYAYGAQRGRRGGRR